MSLSVTGPEAITLPFLETGREWPTEYSTLKAHSSLDSGWDLLPSKAVALFSFVSLEK